MTNASGLARFAALLPEAPVVEDPAGDVPVAVPVLVTSVEAGREDVVVAVLVDDDFRVGWLRVAFREIWIPVPPELAAVPKPVPIRIAVVLAGAMVLVILGFLADEIDETIEERAEVTDAADEEDFEAEVLDPEEPEPPEKVNWPE